MHIVDLRRVTRNADPTSAKNVIEVAVPSRRTTTTDNFPPY